MKLYATLILISFVTFGCTLDRHSINNRYKGIFHGELPVIYSNDPDLKDLVAIGQSPPTWYYLPPSPGPRQPDVGLLVGKSRNHIERQLGPSVAETPKSIFIYPIR